MVEKELVILFKQRDLNEEMTECIPIKVIEGYYSEQDDIFIDNQGHTYFHLSQAIPGLSFAFRENIKDLMKKYEIKSIGKLKEHYFNLISEKKYFIKYNLEETTFGAYTTEKDKLVRLTDKDYPIKESILENMDFEIEEEPYEQENKEPFEVPNIETKKMYEELKKIVIGQDGPIKKILTTMWLNYNSLENSRSKNIFVIGPTGVGKTEIFRNIAKLLNVPIVIEDANDFTISGYYGRDVSDMLKDLLNNANGKQQNAENGILVIDEIDKLAPHEGDKGVATVGVQQALLKIVEDGEFPLSYNNKRIVFNTKKLLVVALGSFSELDLKANVSIGFGQDLKGKQYRDITADDLIKHGMIPELMGRFSTIISLNELTMDNMITIIDYSKNSPFKSIREILATKGITLVKEPGTSKSIAKKAYDLKVGARGIERVIDDSLKEALFEASEEENKYSKLIISPNTIENNNDYKLIRKKDETTK